MKSKRSHRLFLLSTTLGLLLNGCAFTEQYSNYYKEANLSYPAPSNLSGETQSSAILLVDAITEKAFNTLPL